LTSETTDQYKNSVNYTVFYCKAMQACRDVALLLTSPLSPEQQADEWREFFSPDIQARLLPFFLNTTS
jgi:tRNA G26 N,N-dimethylase Trm1